DTPRCLGVEPAVDEALGQADEVRREPVAADVRRLPQPVAELRRERPRQLAALEAAADVAPSVRAHEVERPLDPLAARVEIRLREQLDERLRRPAGDAEDAARAAAPAAEGPDQADAAALG